MATKQKRAIILSQKVEPENSRISIPEICCGNCPWAWATKKNMWCRYCENNCIMSARHILIPENDFEKSIDRNWFRNRVALHHCFLAEIAHHIFHTSLRSSFVQPNKWTARWSCMAGSILDNSQSPLHQLQETGPQDRCHPCCGTDRLKN